MKNTRLKSRGSSRLDATVIRAQEAWAFFALEVPLLRWFKAEQDDREACMLLRYVWPSQVLFFWGGEGF